MTTYKTLTATFGLAFCFAEGPQANETESEPGDVHMSVRGFAVERSEVDDSTSGYSLSGVEMEIQRCHWQFGLTREVFDWQNPGDFMENTGSRDPWGEITRLRFGFSHAGQMSERWTGEVLAGISSDFEEEMDDSYSLYTGGYGVYQLRPRLQILVGMFYSHHPEVDTDFDLVPLLGLIWNPQATEGFSARLGLPVTQASWHFTPDTRLVLDVNTLQGGLTRLADDNPMQPGGYMERVHASLGLRIETRLSGDWQLSAGVGHSLEREITLYDSDGENERSVDIDRGMGIDLTLSTTF